jgi:hypothetical protein
LEKSLGGEGVEYEKLTSSNGDDGSIITGWTFSNDGE